MLKLDIYGMASGKRIKEIKITSSLEENLLSILTKHSLPIASSCDGLGLCQKCIVSINRKTYLSCQIQVKTPLFLENKKLSYAKVEISYL